MGRLVTLASATGHTLQALKWVPDAANTTLRNVTISRGVTDGVGVNSNVSGITITRSTILDVGGKGVGALGALATAEQSVTGFMVANTTITHVGFVFSGGACAVMPVGNGARVLNNDLSDTTYAVCQHARARGIEPGRGPNP